MVAEAKGGRGAIFPVTLRPGGTRFPGLPHFVLGPMIVLGPMALSVWPLASHLLPTLAAWRLVGHGGLSLGTARRPVAGNVRRRLGRGLRQRLGRGLRRRLVITR